MRLNSLRILAMGFSVVVVGPIVDLRVCRCVLRIDVGPYNGKKHMVNVKAVSFLPFIDTLVDIQPEIGPITAHDKLLLCSCHNVLIFIELKQD